MNKICKGIIWTIALVLLIIVFTLNLIFTAYLDSEEYLNINVNTIQILIPIIIAISIYGISYLLEKNNLLKIKKHTLLISTMILYLIIQIIWINYRRAVPSVDQSTTYKFAVDIVENIDAISDTTYGVKIPNSIYMQTYTQQFTIAFLWSILFRLCSSTSYVVVQYFNAVCNCITIIGIYLITEQISKKYKTNKYLSMLIILTFATIPLLSTFVYGDESALAFALLGIYFIMKHTDIKQYRWLILSAVCIAISYILRMNSLIFIIAICIYLVLDIIKERSTVKKVLIKTSLIVIFIIICMLPSSMIKNYYTEKYKLNKNASFPTTGYLLMGMTEGGNGIAGWYKFPTANLAYKDVENAKEIYRNDIKEMLKYYIKNPKVAIAFYIQKISSMWTENTYGGIYYNLSPTFFSSEYVDEYNIDNKLQTITNSMYIYQKALILIIFGCSIIIIIQNRKNLSNELILLLIIFIGGFLFHVLWEAKSRYIIPYIVVLIPVVSVKFNGAEDKLSKILNKVKRMGR